MDSTGDAPLIEVIGAVQDLADYAQARNLDTADELLTELLGVLYTRKVEASQRELVSAENRSMNILRLICEPDLPFEGWRPKTPLRLVASRDEQEPAEPANLSSKARAAS